MSDGTEGETTTTTSTEKGDKVYCVECEDVEAAVRCPACGNDAFCGLCFRYLHRKGARAQHTPVPLPGVDMHAHLEPCRVEGTTEAFAAAFEREQAQQALDRDALFESDDDEGDEEEEEETVEGDKDAAGEEKEKEKEEEEPVEKKKKKTAKKEHSKKKEGLSKEERREARRAKRKAKEEEKQAQGSSEGAEDDEVNAVADEDNEDDETTETTGTTTTETTTESNEQMDGSESDEGEDVLGRGKKRMSRKERKELKKREKEARAQARRARAQAAAEGWDDDDSSVRHKKKKTKKAASRDKAQAGGATTTTAATQTQGGQGEEDELGAWVPMRLLPEERVLLQTLEGVLEVSEYTDHVDVSADYFGWRVGAHSRAATVERELREVLQLLCGLTAAGDYRRGRRLLQRSLAENEDFFQTVFEVGRRYKIMNPDKMRTTYGKLMHALMDYTQSRLGGIAHRPRPILTVRRFLAARGPRALALLRDPRLAAATAVITAAQHDPESSRAEAVAAAIAAKNAARAALVEAYGGCSSSTTKSSSESSSEGSTNPEGSETGTGTGLSDADVERVVDSVYDAQCYLVGNRDPVDRMLGYLEEYFGAGAGEASLAIVRGAEGARLTHGHATQYEFVRQTLLLWREIQTQMFRLWALADEDLLGGGYRLCNTGQGLNRVQPAPRVARAMAQILARVQGAVRGRWVGLSVVHLGDVDVPNALFFIDKYTQVPRILGPLVHAVDRIDVLARDPRAQHLVALCGGADQCKRRILRDYFRHGFDGSGSDGGSCVDGRLTSSWNWCSLVEKKSYYPILLATGFTGFDGSFS